MDNYVVRKASQQDIHPLSLLMQAYIVDFYKCPRPAEESLFGLIQMLYREEEGIQFVAEKNGELVGFATLYFTYSTIKAHKIAIMNDLYVVEGKRGEGVGAGLFQACNSYRMSHDYASMVWDTASSNKRAQAFYKKMGGMPEDWIIYSLEDE
ncbi:GNAT family N-acetyltransferase [Paenibacillus sp. ACRRX]|uniref:GNAT family N-acetyltransferase n=1 Tax=Paenibacillus sp. ACRRX TaxID=2918206 RepID=UPI001EF68811|nr:GNAT family N-acetyltransferase [Paenibacillus sp. ACRRX]MCG7408770.1 GNAT family N-acetyltransferase [Paenibacillus sp. ACRRX]